MEKNYQPLISGIWIWNKKETFYIKRFILDIILSSMQTLPTTHIQLHLFGLSHSSLLAQLIAEST
jgi:hypothetical protein